MLFVPCDFMEINKFCRWRKTQKGVGGTEYKKMRAELYVHCKVNRARAAKSTPVSVTCPPASHLLPRSCHLYGILLLLLLLCVFTPAARTAPPGYSSVGQQLKVTKVQEDLALSGG